MSSFPTDYWLIIIAGPTAVGKTDLSLSVAKYLQSEIISVDSRQLYREMPIGSAMPDEQQLASVRHHFIADRSVNEPLTAGEFEKEALDKMAGLWEKHPVLVAVGGSGLFLKALMEGLDDLPKSDPTLHAKWEAFLALNGLPALQEALLQVDPEYFKQIDQSNPRRLIRALVLA
ncbi:MAG: tRNA (adenosine(37)-N6)-dimethylallyltransferase MiaA, partial [Saprospiraceae bacterium]